MSQRSGVNKQKVPSQIPYFEQLQVEQLEVEQLDVDPIQQKTFNDYFRKKAEKNWEYHHLTDISFTNKPKFGDVGMQMIANFLRTFSEDLYTITIVLEYCGITDRGVGILVAALFEICEEKHIKLDINKISLRGNPITTKGFDYIMHSLRRGQVHYEGDPEEDIEGHRNYYNIKEIDLRGIQMSDEDNSRYYKIVIDYYLDKAKSIYGDKLYTIHDRPQACYMEDITPAFSAFSIPWSDIELYD
jgi:hypothetical protein